MSGDKRSNSLPFLLGLYEMPRTKSARLIPSVPQLTYEHNDASSIDKIIEPIDKRDDSPLKERMSPKHQKMPPSPEDRDFNQDVRLIPGSYIAAGIVAVVVFIALTLCLGAIGAALVLRQKGDVPVVCHIVSMSVVLSCCDTLL